MKQKLLLLLLLPIFTFSQTNVEYDITFTSVWNAGDHGTLPGNAHWSNLVGAVHNDQHTFWEVGELATMGIERVAESGSNTDFFNEVDAQINPVNGNDPNASEWLQKSVDPFAAIATATIADVEFSNDFPLVTLATMIAPSPDWFSGVSNYSLQNTNGSWKTTHTIDVFAYDAGTEDGTGYSGSNPASNPLESIESLKGMTAYGFNDNKIGTITFTLKTTLSNSNFESASAFKLSPNPSNGNVTLSQMQNGINTIAIYDVLGKKVFNETVRNTRIDLNLTNLKSGIYILKVETENQEISSKKLILN